MSSKDSADLLQMIAPFASALLELGQKADEIAGLDSNLEEAKKELAKTKSENATTKANTELLLKQSEQVKAETEKHVADLHFEVESHKSRSLSQIEDAKKQSDVAALALVAKAQADATKEKQVAASEAMAIVQKAHDDTEALRNERADLVAKTETARAEHAKAKTLLDEIKTKLDSIRRA